MCTWGATFTVCPKRLFQCSAASGAQLKTLEPTRKQMLQTQQQLRRASVTWDTVAAPHNPTKLDGTQVMRLQQEVVVELLESTTGDELRMTGFLCWFPFWLGAWGALGGSLEGALGCPFLGGTSWACFAFFSCRGRGGGVGTCMLIPSSPGLLSCCRNGREQPVHGRVWADVWVSCQAMDSLGL